MKCLAVMFVSTGMASPWCWTWATWTCTRHSRCALMRSRKDFYKASWTKVSLNRNCKSTLRRAHKPRLKKRPFSVGIVLPTYELVESILNSVSTHSLFTSNLWPACINSRHPPQCKPYCFIMCKLVNANLPYCYINNIL